MEKNDEDIDSDKVKFIRACIAGALVYVIALLLGFP